MTIITRWNKLFDWRLADISRTDVLKGEVDPTKTYVFSAPAWGLKGKLPGGRHSWVAKKSRYVDEWRTIEISDLETLQYQSGLWHYNKYADPYVRQVVVSDRDPTTKWFGSEPKLEGVFDTQLIPIEQLNEYPFHNKVSLHKNNCNTFLSYLSWRNDWQLQLDYVGYKDADYWEKLLDKIRQK
jgi:hypothetical protein